MPIKFEGKLDNYLKKRAEYESVDRMLRIDLMDWWNEKHESHLEPPLYIFELEVGSWPCSESPIKRCFYDRYRDPVCDTCLICGQPLERK